MADNRENPFDKYGYNSEIIPTDIVAGYAAKYMPNYVFSTVDGKNFLNMFFGIVQGESGFEKYVKAAGNETSYGLLQINWHVHKDEIVRDYPQFKQAGITNIDVWDMSDEMYEKLLPLITDLDFQFSFGNFLMDRRKNAGKHIFSDWSAFNNDSYLLHMDTYSKDATTYSQLRPEDLISRADGYTAGGPPVSPPLSDDPNDYDPAETSQRTGGVATPEDKWKQIKQYYGQEFYDMETDTWVGNFQNDPGYQTWESIFGDFLPKGANTTYLEFFDDSGNDRKNLITDQYRIVTAAEGFFNPFSLGSLLGPPTVADAVKTAVYERYYRSAVNQGFSHEVASSLALGHLVDPQAIDLMNRAVTMGQESGLTNIYDLVDLVAGEVSNYTGTKGYNKWSFTLPNYKDTNLKSIASMNEKINNKVRSVLLSEGNAGLVDEIRRAYTDYKIINPNVELSIEDFAMPFIKETDRYKRIYKQKPAMFSPEQYINQYVQGVGSVMSTGDSNYEEMVASQASLGGTMQEAQTGAFFGSARVGLGDTFKSKVNALAERIGGMLND
tara:strand:+ start:3785 stop:5443 length:1659 start_codon:yes stop_codon:yes gene_type:complete